MKFKMKGVGTMRVSTAFIKSSLRLILKLLKEGRNPEAITEIEQLISDL